MADVVPPAAAVQPPSPARVSSATPKQDSYDLWCSTILQVNCKAGVDMMIKEFCKMFELGEGIKEKFHEHSYMHAQMLRFITITPVNPT